MQVPLMLMLAVTGLGCHNKTSGALDGIGVTRYQVDSPSLPSYQGRGTSTPTDSGSFVSTPYPEIPSHLYNTYSVPDSVDWRTELHSTLYSFVFGRDPNVSTVRDIEASVYGTDYGR
jgi:hypothetical protein